MEGCVYRHPFAMAQRQNDPACDWHTESFVSYCAISPNKKALRKGPRERKTGFNPRPSAWEADALPTELFPHYGVQSYSVFFICQVFEPRKLRSVHDFFQRREVLGIFQPAALRGVEVVDPARRKCSSTLPRTTFIVLFTSPFCSVNASSTMASPAGSHRSGNSPA